METRYTDVIKVRDLKKGRFYQIPKFKSKRLANRIFQKYDRCANRSISKKEVKLILKQTFKAINPQREFTKEEIKKYTSLLDQEQNGEGELKEPDFIRLVELYYTNDDGIGASDFEKVHEDIMFYNYGEERNQNYLEEVHKEIIQVGYKRFGKKFIDLCIKISRQLFIDQGYNLKDEKKEYDYGEIFHVYKKMNEKINKIDAYQMFFEDYEKLIAHIDYSKNGGITYREFELFFLRGILGS